MTGPARSGDVPRLKALWQSAFGDDPAVIDRFFQSLFRPDSTVVCWDGDDAVAMAHWLPMTVCRDGKGWPIAYVYAVANFVGGGIQFEVMSRAEVEAVRDKSQGYQSAVASAKRRNRPDVDSPWVSYFEEMAKKTAIRRLAKYLPLSVEAARAVAVDEAADRGEFLDDVIDQEYVVKGGEPPAFEGDFDDIEPETTPAQASAPAPASDPAPKAAPNQPDVPPAPPFPMDEADLASMSPADIKRRAASKE